MFCLAHQPSSFSRGSTVWLVCCCGSRCKHKKSKIRRPPCCHQVHVTPRCNIFRPLSHAAPYLLRPSLRLSLRRGQSRTGFITGSLLPLTPLLSALPPVLTQAGGHAGVPSWHPIAHVYGKIAFHLFNSTCCSGTAYFEPAPRHPTAASTTADTRLRSSRSPDGRGSRGHRCGRRPHRRPLSARANLLCAEEAAHTHDAQARGDDFRALKQPKAMQRKVASIHLRQAQAVEAQGLVDIDSLDKRIHFPSQLSDFVPLRNGLYSLRAQPD